MRANRTGRKERKGREGTSLQLPIDGDHGTSLRGVIRGGGWGWLGVGGWKF
jgi:hypothetical protein